MFAIPKDTLRWSSDPNCDKNVWLEWQPKKLKDETAMVEQRLLQCRIEKQKDMHWVCEVLREAGTSCYDNSIEFLESE